MKPVTHCKGMCLVSGKRGVLSTEILSKHPRLVATLFIHSTSWSKVDPSGLPGSPHDFTLTICVPWGHLAWAKLLSNQLWPLGTSAWHVFSTVNDICKHSWISKTMVEFIGFHYFQISQLHVGKVSLSLVQLIETCNYPYYFQTKCLLITTLCYFASGHKKKEKNLLEKYHSQYIFAIPKTITWLLSVALPLRKVSFATFCW